MESRPGLEVLDINEPRRMVQQPATGEPLSKREQGLLVQMVCLLIANGESMTTTAKKLGLAVASVEAIVNNQQGIEMIVRMQHDACPDPQMRVKKMASIALDVQTRMLLDPKTPEATRAKVAQDVIDRAHGKAVQTIETRDKILDLKDVNAIDRAMQAQTEKLKRIEDLQKKLKR